MRTGRRPGGAEGAAGVSIDRNTATALVIITLFVMLLMLPFLRQPYHIDDVTFLDMAKSQLQHPFQLHIDDYQLMGENLPEWRDTHPPGLSLYLAAVMTLTGSEAEPVTHGSYLIFPLITGVAMYFLARRFTHNPLLATLLLLATPMVMTNSHTLMGDLPTTALWLGSTALYIYGVDRDNRLLLGLAGAAMTLALFIGYQALALLVLLPLYALLNHKLTWRTLAPLALPIIAFSAFSAYNLWRYDSLPRFSHRRGLGLTGSHLWDRLQGALLKLGGTTIFPLALSAAFALRRAAAVLLPAALAASIALAIRYHDSGGLSVANAALYVVFMATSLLTLGSIFTDTAAQLLSLTRRRRADADLLFLGLWLGMGLTAIVLLLPHASVKYYLPLLAPLVLLFVRELETRLHSASLARGLLVISLVLTLVLGLVISVVDYRYARSYRDFTREISGIYPYSQTVWFMGEWGFRYYLEQEGYRYLTSTSNQPVEGDIFLEPSLMGWPISPQLTNRLELIDTMDTFWGFPVRVMNYDANAGYYGSHWGALPYAFTNAPVESFRIYRVGPPAPVDPG